MAKINLKVDLVQKCWVKPLVYSAAFVFAAAGKSEFPKWFLDFVANHGFKIGVKR